MRVLITGSNGMLGSELVRRIGTFEDIVGVGRGPNKNPGLTYYAADIGDSTAIKKVFENARSEWLIHAAAMTDVDGCEDRPDEADRVNGEGARVVGEAARALGMKAILISTDYVFDGKKERAYDENDTPKPLSAYGRSKFKAEGYWRALFPEGEGTILRSSWLFGKGGRNFVASIADLATKGQPFSVVADQWGSPTYTVDLADAIRKLIRASEQGECALPPVLHFANRGAISRFLWAQYIARTLGTRDDLIKPIVSEESGRRARRPERGVLDTVFWKKMFKSWPRDVWQVTHTYLHNEWRNADHRYSYVNV